MKDLNNFTLKSLPLNDLKGYLMGITCIRKIKDYGHKAYFVGGCVRDLITGIVPHDWDIVTNCSYDEIRSIFPYPSHGEITKKFLVHAFVWDNEELEIAEFRRDDGDNRSSISLQGNIKTDSERRDFTLNAIYWDPTTGDILDPVGGMGDLKERKLKTCKDPDFVFKQDPIRVIRGMGFQRKFNLTDCVGLKSYSYLLKGINATRLRQECIKRDVAVVGVDRRSRKKKRADERLTRRIKC